MSERKPVVLVTGANGFVGGHVVPALTRAGWSVRRAVRSAEGTGDEVVIETIGPETDWTGALDGVDAVVHLAARVHHKHEEHAEGLYRSVNTAGTLHLARCAAAAGVRQFIFVSTALVHGRCNAGRPPFSEDDVLKPSGLYGMSKAEAESGLRRRSSGSEMKITVVRPPLIYGEGAKGNFALLTRAVKIGLPLPLAGIRNRRAFLAVQNLASFIVWRLADPRSTSNFEVFLVADQEQVSTPELIRRVARASGKSPRLFYMQPQLLNFLLNIFGRLDAHDSLIGSFELDVSKALGIGWQPQVSLDEGLRLALAC